MIQEALQWIAANFRKDRPALLAPADGSHRLFVFDDAEGDYKTELPRYNKRERCVSNIESFAAMVLEEARRKVLRRPDDPVTDAATKPVMPGLEAGNWMTVLFSGLGALFYLDDCDTRTVFQYKRELSPQWKLLTAADGRGMEHRAFVRLLQSLRPSLVDPGVIIHWRKINLAAGVQIESAPTLEAGRSGNSYRFDLKVNGRNAEALAPETIRLKLPFARGSARTYEIEAEVTCELVEHEGRKTPQFGIILPERPVIEDQAVADEVADFREAVKPLSLLSILEDY